jgi:hypothetical protein
MSKSKWTCCSYCSSGWTYPMISLGTSEKTLWWLMFC